MRTHRLQLAVLPESNNKEANYTKLTVLLYHEERTFLVSLPGHWVVGGVVSVVRVGGDSTSLQRDKSFKMCKRFSLYMFHKHTVYCVTKNVY